MELNFKNNNGMYEAEFAASDAFNLNLVRENKGLISIFLKGASDGVYPTKASYRELNASTVVDVDVTAAAYPKYIKIVSSSPVIKGTITTDGEAIEIPSSSGGGSGDIDNPLDYPRFVKMTAYNYENEIVKEGILSESGELTASYFTGINPKMIKCEAFYTKDGENIKYFPKNATSLSLENMGSAYLLYLTSSIVDGDYCLIFNQRVWTQEIEVYATFNIDGLTQHCFLQAGK